MIVKMMRPTHKKIVALFEELKQATLPNFAILYELGIWFVANVKTLVYNGKQYTMFC